MYIHISSAIAAAYVVEEFQCQLEVGSGDIFFQTSANKHIFQGNLFLLTAFQGYVMTYKL